MKYGKTILLILFFVAIILLNLYGEKEEMNKKVIILGIDAFDPKVINNLMDDGKLPNFQKLKEEGTYSELKTTIPPESPVAWSSAATGTNPGKHGIFDFINRNTETYLPKLNLVEREDGFAGTKYKSPMKEDTFWNMVGDKGIPITVIRWPVTFPPEKINGKILSGLGTVDIKGLLNSYQFYTTENLDEIQREASVIVVKKGRDRINTYLSGPLKKEKQKIIEVKAPMNISIKEGYVILRVNGNEYEIEHAHWSDWIRVKFNIGFMKNVYGIFKVYLISTEPEFKMYVSSIEIDPVNPLYDITFPRDYSKELAEEIGLFHTLGMPEETKAVNDKRISKGVFLEQINEIEEERVKMFWYEFNNFEKSNSGLYVFGFDSGDRLQHIFWNKTKGNEFKIPKGIEEYYIEKDKFLGEVLNKLDANTKIIIFSDHGFSNFDRAVTINRWLVEKGYMSLKEELKEGNAGELFKYIDWEKTKAYSLGFTSIYINLKGRESKGIVKEEDKNNLVNEIISELNDLVDPETRINVISKVYVGQEIYSGKYQENSPEIIIGFSEGYRMSWQNAAGGITPEVFLENNEEWKGDHLIEREFVPGVLFTNFKIEEKDPEIIDLAPTILKIFDIKIPENIDGKSLI